MPMPIGSVLPCLCAWADSSVKVNLLQLDKAGFVDTLGRPAFLKQKQRGRELGVGTEGEDGGTRSRGGR